MVSVPPPRHGLDGVESQIQEGLGQLGGVGHDQRQVGRQTAHELNALVAQFVPGEQPQIVQQLIDVDRAQIGLGAARKIQDLLHDLVQVVHFFPQDGVVLDPRIARREIPAGGNGRAFS